MIEPWFSSSVNSASPSPASWGIKPAFPANPLMKYRAASRRLKRAIRFSSSSWRSMFPAIGRTLPLPAPWVLIASRAARLTFGWVERLR